MSIIIETQKEIPVLYEADVVVVGGGPAGIGAALAASRNGAKTILLEQLAFLGGAATNCLNPNWELRDPALLGGILQEVIQRLDKAGMILFDTDMGSPFDMEYYKYLLDIMMQESNVKVLLHAFGATAIKEGNTIKGVFIESKEGRQAILAKVVIDCTGSADIAWKSGTPCMTEGHPSGRSNYTYSAFYGGIDYAKFYRLKDQQPNRWFGMPQAPKFRGKSLIPTSTMCLGGFDIVAKARAEGKLYQNCNSITIGPHSPLGTGRGFMMSHHIIFKEGQHGWRVEDLTYGEMDGRKSTWSTYNFLKENVPGFEMSYIEQTPSFLGMRDTHRILGEYVLSSEDIKLGNSFDDSVCIGYFASDTHGPDEGHEFDADVLPYDIPYRCLVPQETENLLAAGMIISTDYHTWNSVRNMSVSMCTGEAAGTAAALSVKANVSPRKVDVKMLQETLRKQGAQVSIKNVPEEVLDEYKKRPEMLKRLHGIV